MVAAQVLGFAALPIFVRFYDDPTAAVWATLYEEFFDLDFSVVFDLSWLINLPVGSSILRRLISF